jgi:putative addiction module antidote
MAQKIIKIGSSVGITLPKDLLERAGLAVGDNIEVESQKDGTIKVVPVSVSAGSETAQWATRFVQKHIKAFKELADK